MLSTSTSVEAWTYEEKPDLQDLQKGLHRSTLHMKEEASKTRGLDSSRHEDFFLINDVVGSPLQIKQEPQNPQHYEEQQGAPISGPQDFKAQWWSDEEDEEDTSDSQDSADLVPVTNSTRGLVTFKSEAFLMTSDDSGPSVQLKQEPQDSQRCEEQGSPDNLPMDFRKHWWSNEKQEGHLRDRLNSSDTEHVTISTTGVDTFRPKGIMVSSEGQISAVKVKLEPEEAPVFCGGPHNPPGASCQDFTRSWRSDEEHKGPQSVIQDPAGVDTFRPKGIMVSSEGKISAVKVKLEPEEAAVFCGGPHNPTGASCQDFTRSWRSDEEHKGPQSVIQDPAGLDSCKPNTVMVPGEGEISRPIVKLEPEETPVFEAHNNPLKIGCEDFRKRWWGNEQDERLDSSDNSSRKKHKLESPERCTGDQGSDKMVYAVSSENEETSNAQKLVPMNAEYQPALSEYVPKSVNSSEEQGAHPSLMTYICNKCGKCFDSASSHVCQHVYRRSYTGDKPYKCDQCPESFFVSSALLIHQGTHRKDKQYICSECGIKCASALRLLTHEKTHKRLNKEEGVHHCITGEKGFHDSLSLRLHQQEHAEMETSNQHTDASPEQANLSIEELNLKTRLNSNSECGEGFNSTMTNDLKIHSGEMIYQSDECGVPCASALQLTQHQETHSGLTLEDRVFQCPKCEQCFCDSWSLTIHQQEHAGMEMTTQHGGTSPIGKSLTLGDLNLSVKPHSCSECGSRFKLESTLMSHLKKHTVENSYPCIECGLKCDSASQLLEHLKIHSTLSKTGLNLEEETFQCLMCEERFCNSGSLTIHQQEHTEMENISQHNSTGPEGENLNSEELTLSTKPHVCCECGKTFKLESRLRSHLKAHTGEKLFPCTECGKKCVSELHLIKHQKIHSGLTQDDHTGPEQKNHSMEDLDLSEKPHSCSECGKRFKLESTLISHLKIHTVENPYPCVECGLKCESASHLLEHQKTHNIFTKIKLNLEAVAFPGSSQKEEVFQCLKCENLFCDSRSLQIHQREHTGMEITAKLAETRSHRTNVNFEELNLGIKPHLCTECGKSFKLEATLISHLKIHAGEKPFTCIECGKKCVSAPHLIEHQKIHTGLTKTKTSLETLSTGLKLKEEMFQCCRCEMIFFDSLSLAIHEQEHATALEGDARPERNHVNFEECNPSAAANLCSHRGESDAPDSALVTHLQTHKEEAIFGCSTCGVKDGSASHPSEHQEGHTGMIQLKEVHQCQSCEQTFCDLQSLTMHQQEHAEKALTTQEANPGSEKRNLSAEEVKLRKPHACTECDKRFTLKSKLISHLKIHTGERPFTCSECGKTFRDTILLRKHQLIHTEEKPYSCSECGKTFSVKGYLFRHQKIHTGKKPHLCKVCGRGFTHASTRIKHEQTHAGLKPHKCEECGKAFSDMSSVLKHQLTHTGEKPFSCTECGKSFGRSCHLIRHLKMHTGELPYVCGECGQSFADASSLTKHRLSHTGAKPYACELCGKNFGRSSHLNRHQQIHTGEKPFPCDECGRRFGALSTLHKHQRIHTGEKPYMCIECRKSFRDASSLKIHQRVHTGEKPYVCRECGVSFSRSVYLKKHHMQHMGMNSHTCDCGLTFTNTVELGEHQLKHTEVVTHTL
ncbi:hypothetical protein NDU88_009525 [Pleurodeles waltl]|uniref:C2H2-type domain-containing protein n=2 Tax=Pleurodeles waltl TaxID=8319 RepID=A0AAV7NZF6_PLEWA|nr:hypothetical protein NDU88_009525 [Pleurodeles waltl]